MTKYLILHDRDEKFLSMTPLNAQSRDRLRAVYCCTLMRTDPNGNERWKVIGAWGNSVQGRKLAGDYRRKYGADPLDTPARKAA
jgi:hypothetical protein